jgi:hypothetical protein
MNKTITVAITEEDSRYVKDNGLSPTALLREKINEKKKSESLDKIMIDSPLFKELKKEVIARCMK